MRVVTVDPPDGEGDSAHWVHKYDGWLARRGWLTSERHHVMTPIQNGTGTHYKTWEPFGGRMKVLVPYRKIDDGFKAQAQQLKVYVEQLHRASA